jgi:hypothetical protein
MVKWTRKEVKTDTTVRYNKYLKKRRGNWELTKVEMKGTRDR